MIAIPTSGLTSAFSGRTRVSRRLLKGTSVAPRDRAADARRCTDQGLTARGKTLNMGPLRRWSATSPVLASAAPRGWPGGTHPGGRSPVRFSRAHSVPQTVAMQQSGPSSRGAGRSAVADIRLGGLDSGLLQLALGDVRGSIPGLRRHAGLHHGRGVGHHGQRIGAVSSSFPLSNHAVQRTETAPPLRASRPVGGCAVPAADGGR